MGDGRSGARWGCGSWSGLHVRADLGVEIVVIFSGVSATLAEIIGKTQVKKVISAGLGDGTNASLPSPPVSSGSKSARRKRLPLTTR